VILRWPAAYLKRVNNEHSCIPTQQARLSPAVLPKKVISDLSSDLSVMRIKAPTHDAFRSATCLL